MAKFDVIMPKMGESITEATITKWLVKEGSLVAEDDPLVEIATDKVDSEIPSPVEGVLTKLLFEEGDVVAVGKKIAEISMEDESNDIEIKEEPAVKDDFNKPTEIGLEQKLPNEPKKFYSPLVKKIAKEENLSFKELDEIVGSGKNGRVNKHDVLAYIEQKSILVQPGSEKVVSPDYSQEVNGSDHLIDAVSIGAMDEVIEMDRVRKLIADHMVMSKQVSPHVNSFIEIDMTKIVNWRNKVKKAFLDKHGEKITYTHLFIEAIAKALQDYPRINASLLGNNILIKKDINIGMATALPNGNLIVPVIKKSEEKNLIGIVKSVNDLANRARNNKLKPDEIQGGTFSFTNLGSFGTDFGTPIINQPQLAILATGAIKKKAVVLESPEGDTIGVRSMMFVSLAYDHRVIDGALGGMFLKRFAEYLENFDVGRSV